MAALLKVWLVRPELAALPTYASAGAAGLDLRAALSESMLLRRGKQARVPTGIALSLPSGHEGQVRPRSGLAARHGVTVLNAPGTIDEDYRGEIEVLLINHGSSDYRIEPGERIAQLVVCPVERVLVQAVDTEEELGSTTRGIGGFGSTGRH